MPGKPPNPLDRITPVPAGEPVPAIDFFRPAMFHSPELNPAGTHFVAIVSMGADREDAFVYDLAANTGGRLTVGRNRDISGCTWLDDRRFLFHMTQDKEYALGLCAADITRLSRVTVIERFNVIVPVGVPREAPLKPIIWIRNNAVYEGEDGGVVQIDSQRSFESGDSDNASVIDRFPSPRGGTPVGYLADKDGHLAFAFTAKDGVTTLHRYVKDHWEKCSVDMESIDVVANGERPDELFVLGPREGNRPRALQRFDASTGKLGEVVYQDDKYDLDHVRLYRRETDGRLLGLRYNQRLPKQVWLDQRYLGIQAAVEKVLPDLVVNILGSDHAEKRFFLAAYSDVMPLRYYHFDLEKAQLTEVASTAPWIDPKRMRPMMGMTYKTRDGVSLEGYVTLPENASKANPAPLVVLPHGGPWVREVWAWDREAQFLASRGYAVFQPNYRGSTGYGCRYPEDDNWAFRKMHDDVTDGVKGLLTTGVVDKNRIAIMGSSFGGYLALSGAAYEPDLYRCAITIAGVFDWAMMVKSKRGSEHFRGAYGLYLRKLGDPKKDQERFDAISPIRHVDQVKIPISVAHGVDDQVAPVEQSQRLISELKKHGVPFEKQIESNETHGFHHLENEVALYTAIEKFLAKNLAPKSGGAN